MKNTGYMLLGVVIAFAAVFFVKYIGASHPSVNEVSTRYVADNLAQVVLIDVREPDELKNDGYIKGAVNIPLSTLSSNMDKIPKDKEVIVYCHSGRRSGIAAEQLKQAGYTNIKSMIGGITAWKNEGHPVIR